MYMINISSRNVYFLKSLDQKKLKLHKIKKIKSTEEEEEISTKSKIQENKNDEEMPIWIRREKLAELQEQENKGDIPFYVSLPIAGIIAIAAIGSIFEIFNKNAIFGLIKPENPLWLPILVFFVLTGIPTSAYFFFKAVDNANKIAEQMDKIDNV